MLEEFNIEEGNIKIQDMGALDCTIKARIETAILRLKEEK
jgi:citrate lyase acyl carrier protein